MIRLPNVSAFSATLRSWFYVSVIGRYRSLRFEEFRREEEFKTSSLLELFADRKFKTSPPVAAHPS